MMETMKALKNVVKANKFILTIFLCFHYIKSLVIFIFKGEERILIYVEDRTAKQTRKLFRF